MGFSGSVNGTTKNPSFLDFGFCQLNVNGPIDTVTQAKVNSNPDGYF